MMLLWCPVTISVELFSFESSLSVLLPRRIADGDISDGDRGLERYDVTMSSFVVVSPFWFF